MDKCQVYLGDRRHMYLGAGHRPSPTAIHSDARLLSTYETKMAARTGKHSILRSYEKIGNCERSTFHDASHVFFSLRTVSDMFSGIDTIAGNFLLLCIHS